MELRVTHKTNKSIDIPLRLPEVQKTLGDGVDAVDLLSMSFGRRVQLDESRVEPRKQARTPTSIPTCAKCGKPVLPRALMVYSKDTEDKRCLCYRSRTPSRGNLLNISRKQILRPAKHVRRVLNRHASGSRLPPAELLEKYFGSMHKFRSLNSSHTMLDLSQEKETSGVPALNAGSTPQAETKRFMVLPGNNSRLVAKLMKRRAIWVEETLPPTQFAWHPDSRTVRFDRHVSYLETQVVNHFEYHGELSSKLQLYMNLKAYCELTGKAIATMMPLTFCLELESSHLHAQYSTFIMFFKTLADKKNKKNLLPPTHFAGANVWLLKPSRLNRGRGIYIFSTLEELKEIMNDYTELARAQQRREKPRLKHKSLRLPSETFIIQKYIESPLLIHGRKFDIRMWVLVTHEMVGYMYREGYLRTASESFTLESDTLKSEFVHLTNNAVQKNGPKYGRFEAGNQLSFGQLQQYLDSHGVQGNVVRDLVPQMKSLVKSSLLSVSATQVQSKLNWQKRSVCFELFGYDFIVDEELCAWLIEVNTNPCLELSSPLLMQLIPRMLDDMLTLTVDKVFPTNYISELKTKAVIDLPSGNNWEHVVTLSPHKANI